MKQVPSLIHEVSKKKALSAFSCRTVDDEFKLMQFSTICCLCLFFFTVVLVSLVIAAFYPLSRFSLIFCNQY